jgi:hypothetical protein
MRQTETYARLVISLSEEELFVTLKLLQAPTPVGIDLSRLQNSSNGYSSEHVTDVLSATFRGLVARGYLVPLQENSKQPLPLAPSQELRRQPWTYISLSQIARLLVSTSAFATRSLLLSWHTANGKDLLYIHEHDGSFVITMSPLPGVYTFIALNCWEAVWQFLTGKLAIQECTLPELSLPSIKLRRETLQHLQEYVAQPEEEQRELYTRLTQAGLPSFAVQAMLEMLQQVQVVAGFQMFFRDHKANNGTNSRLTHRMGLMITARNLLVAEPQHETSEMLLIRQATVREVENIVHALWS